MSAAARHESRSRGRATSTRSSTRAPGRSCSSREWAGAPSAPGRRSASGPTLAGASPSRSWWSPSTPTARCWGSPPATTSAPATSRGPTPCTFRRRRSMTARARSGRRSSRRGRWGRGPSSRSSCRSAAGARCSSPTARRPRGCTATGRISGAGCGRAELLRRRAAHDRHRDRPGRRGEPGRWRSGDRPRRRDRRAGQHRAHGRRRRRRLTDSGVGALHLTPGVSRPGRPAPPWGAIRVPHARQAANHRWRSREAAIPSGHDRCRVRPQLPRDLRALALHPDLGPEPGRDRGDADRVRRRPPRPVSRISRIPEALVSARPEPTHHSNWTTAARRRVFGTLPPEKLLPDGQPSYVASWIYVFGVLTLTSLAVIILSGTILALKGPGWWHDSSIGHFFNSVHLWAVELFFFFMVIHLWGKYWMSAWRGGRARVWMTGAVTFLVAIPCALTGYVAQQNFDAQWISTQAKDAMNAVGIGSFFNLLNFGQIYGYHVFLLPAAVVALAGAHVLLVRRHGVVPPLEV